MNVWSLVRMGRPAFQSILVTLTQDTSLTLRLRLSWLAPSDAFECTQMHFGLPFLLAFSLQCSMYLRRCSDADTTNQCLSRE
eukprot:scaffold12962_cov58-Skeletonema_marinoi.AAC.1